MKKEPLLPMNLQFFAEDPEGGQETPTFSFDDFKAFAESNEEAQKYLTAQGQSVADKQLESWKSKHLDGIKEQAIKEHDEAKNHKSPEQMQLEKLQKDFEAEKNLRVTSDNKAYVAQQISDLDFDGELKGTIGEFMLNSLVSADSEATQKAVEAFTGVLTTLQEKHQDEIKELEMGKAFGKNKQNNSNNQSSEVEPKDPMASLENKLESFLN